MLQGRGYGRLGGVRRRRGGHAATAVSGAGEVLLDRRAPNRPADLEALVAELAASGDDLTTGVDVVGSVAGLPRALKICSPRVETRPTAVEEWTRAC